LHVLDDEDFLAWLDQAKLAPGDLFDRGRIVTQAPGLLGQACILGALARQRRRQRGGLTPDAQHRQQAAVARQRIHHDHQRDEQQPEAQQATVARLSAERLRLSDRLRSVGRRHASTKVH
jgi:hypothetical protein